LFVANLGNVIPTLQNVVLFQLCFEIPTKFQGSSQSLTHVHVDKKKYAFIDLKRCSKKYSYMCRSDVLIHKNIKSNVAIVKLILATKIVT
jgi:hypothetical protein